METTLICTGRHELPRKYLLTSQSEDSKAENYYETWVSSHKLGHNRQHRHIDQMTPRITMGLIKASQFNSHRRDEPVDQQRNLNWVSSANNSQTEMYWSTGHGSEREEILA